MCSEKSQWDEGYLKGGQRSVLYFMLRVMSNGIVFGRRLMDQVIIDPTKQMDMTKCWSKEEGSFFLIFIVGNNLPNRILPFNRSNGSLA